jgi:hypothetical protein
MEPCDARWGGAIRAERKPPPKSVVILAARTDGLLRGGIFLLPAALESEAVPVHFQNVNVMGESIQERSGQPFRPQHFGPLGKGQVAGYQVWKSARSAD